MALTLMDHQRKTVDYGKQNNYAIYALQQGLGKSGCGIITAVETKSTCLIVCPAYLRLKWKAEIQKFCPGAVAMLFENDKGFFRLWDVDFAIISYNSVPKAEILFEWADMVVWDEGHMLKTMAAKRTEAAHKFVFENSLKRCLILTGTPIQNRVWEFYSLLAMCNYDPRISKSGFLEKYPTWVDFADRFSHREEYYIPTERGNRLVVKYSGHKNLEELKQWTKGHYIRFTSEEVLDLPPYTEIEVPMSYDNNPALLDAFMEFSVKAEEGQRTWGVGSDVKARAALAKAHFTSEYVQNLVDQCEQVVVYTDHVDSCEFLAKLLGVPAITGEMDHKIRQSLADKFMRGESQVIVATIGSFSTGIDLYSSANMVFNDFNFVPGNMEQAMYRIRRIGQTRHCYFHFIMGSMQDFKIWEILKEKIKTINAVI